MKTITKILVGLIFFTQLQYSQWYQQSSGTGQALNGISFSDANNGMAVGGDYVLGGASNSIILRTTNGGGTWITQSTVTEYCLFGVSFNNANIGTAVGDYGTILRTTDGGTTWISQASGTTNWLYSVSFTDINNGTVVGENGIILKTINGGTTWILQSSGTSVFLCGVHFIDENIGTVVGQNGVILRTTNGGTSWTHQPSGTGLVLVGICFTDTNNGTVVGGDYDFEGNGSWWSIILRTTNGGGTWITQSSGTEYMLTGISFTDVSNGTAVGWGSSDGIILRTTDGGSTWTAQSGGTANGLFGVCFTNANTGTVVGSNGTILRTTNGGITFNDEEKNEITTNDFVLSQNYPNPFNPSTKISWQSPVGSWQTLKVYDLLGNEVATLVDGYKPAGSYEIAFNAAGFSSGIYFYTINAGNFVESKKMLLLK